MKDLTPNVIRDRLDHPDITSVNVKENRGRIVKREHRVYGEST